MSWELQKKWAETLAEIERTKNQTLSQQQRQEALGRQLRQSARNPNAICLHCSGTGKAPCPYCHGEGKSSCSSCGGRGYNVEPVMTPFGLNTQSTICIVCKKTGYQSCVTCEATGKLPCECTQP